MCTVVAHTGQSSQLFPEADSHAWFLSTFARTLVVGQLNGETVRCSLAEAYMAFGPTSRPNQKLETDKD
jgi:hypothetical protein